ncbi:MAG: hypothetical protein HS126_02405 [Anaerolineales bacterium]|nr:hypothetical protein [Anaerolineales bacterium]
MRNRLGRTVPDGGVEERDSITFQRFEDYWGSGQDGDVDLPLECGRAQRLLELQSGSVDGIDNPTPDDFEVIAGTMR